MPYDFNAVRSCADVLCPCVDCMRRTLAKKKGCLPEKLLVLPFCLPPPFQVPSCKEIDTRFNPRGERLFLRLKHAPLPGPLCRLSFELTHTASAMPFIKFPVLAGGKSREYWGQKRAKMLQRFDLQMEHS